MWISGDWCTLNVYVDTEIIGYTSLLNMVVDSYILWVNFHDMQLTELRRFATSGSLGCYKLPS